jgi:threonine dehydratase
VVPPYDHADVIAGQGTAALELIEDVGPLDVLLVCVGGGGLIGGSALAAHARSPGVRVYGAEPEAADDAARSLATGVLQTVHNPDTIADGARTPSLGRLTFPLLRRDVAGILTVSDAELIAAMRWAALHLKLVLEPTGVLGLALALSGRLPLAGLTVGVILSGGNVDPPDFARWIGGPL